MKAEIIDIKLTEYLSLDEKTKEIYDKFIEDIKPDPELKQIFDLTFDEVETLKIALQRFDLESVKAVYNVFKDKEPDDDDLYLYEIMQMWKTGIEILKEVVNFEKKLQADITNEQKEAGIENFNVLKSSATKITLGKQFGKRPRDIGEWLWFEVWEIRLYNVIESNYNQALAKIRQRNILKQT